MTYFLEIQKIAHRDWPGRHPSSTMTITYEFHSLDQAMTAYCKAIRENYERARVWREYKHGHGGSIAVYNKTFDELT
jgi:hypothetical protein